MKPQAEDMESSEEENEEGEDESSSDEFDSADARVNVIPSQVASQTLSPSAHTQSSDESSSEEEDEEEEEEEDDEEENGKVAEDPQKAGIKVPEASKIAESDSESEEESEGLAHKDMINAQDLSARKGKSGDVPKKDNKFALIKALKTHGLKQVLEDEQPLMKGEGEGQPSKKSQGKALKSVRKEDDQPMQEQKTGEHSTKKRKVESLQNDGENESLDSVAIAKRRKDIGAGHDAEKSTSLGNGDKLKKAVNHDTGREIARKTLSDTGGKVNGSADKKVSRADTVSKQEVEANMSAAKHQKKLPHVWSVDEEITMASEVLSRTNLGLGIPSKRSDEFWVGLSETLHEKLGVEFSREQLSEKLRRMKHRYENIVKKIKESEEAEKEYKHKNPKEQSLFNVWSQIWGRSQVLTLDDNEAAKEVSRPFVAISKTVKDVKGSKTSKSRSNEKVSKQGEDFVSANTLGSEPFKTNKIINEDNCNDGLQSIGVDGSALCPKNVCKELHDNIRTSLRELQEWSKHSMEEWMRKAMTLIENSVKALGDRTRHIDSIRFTGGELPMTLWDPMDYELAHGERAFQQQWYELELQELSIYAQRLELMRKECELKQEQLKLKLKVHRGT